MSLQTIQKTIQILEFIVSRGACDPVRELSAKLGIPRSTINRICQGLAKEGLLRFDNATKRYQVGPRLENIADILYRKNAIQRLSLPILREMMSECNETAILVVYESSKTQVVFSEEVECNQPIRYHTPLGVMLPIHAGASGKAILAFLPEDVIEAIVSRGLQSLTGNTITNPELLKNELAEVRRKGYSISSGEREPGAVGIASPVFDATGLVAGGLIVTIPEYRFRPEMEARISGVVKRSAERLSRELGLSASLAYPPSGGPVRSRGKGGY